MNDMIQTTESGERLSFSSLFKDKGYEILIPIIQRDYAQGRASNEEIRVGFLSALKGYLDEGKPNRDLDFIYGSLIIEEGGSQPCFVPLDGQQRLTTLFLLHWYLAIKENKTEQFRQVFAKALSERRWRSLFTYETRTSATEFCNALVSATIDLEQINKDLPSLSHIIRNQQWYFLSWRNDPTIQGMLVMLDALHKLFGTEEQMYYERLTNTERPIITFQFLKLEQFGLTDDLYIKMNARGKPLTSFENFKAKFSKQLESPEFNSGTFTLGEEGNTRTVQLHEYVSHKIDTDWANLFWAHAKDELAKAKKEKRVGGISSNDDMLMNFFKTYAINYIAGRPDSDKQVRGLINTSSNDLTFNQFKEYECFDAISTPKLIRLLDCLANDDNKAKRLLEGFHYYDETVFERFLNNSFSSAEYGNRVMFHAYTQYLTYWPNNIEEEYIRNLKNWMRIIRNLTASTAPYNSERVFANSIKGINKAIIEGIDIHAYLTQGYSISGFDKAQVFEEKMKVCLINKQTGWDTLIYEAEQHGYFNGQIGFILRLSGVTSYYKDHSTCDWSAEADRQYQQGFKDYHHKALAIFDNNGLKKSLSYEGNYIWERALLATGNYLIKEGSNHSFLIDKDRDISWQRLLKGDKEESHAGLIKTIFDAIDLEDVNGSLESIIHNSKSKDWRQAFISTPDLIEYLLSKRYVRFYSNHGFVLFKGERMSGGHAELYSYKFFLDYLENKATEPFSEKYYYSASGSYTDHFPCAVLTGWQDTEYEINVTYAEAPFLDPTHTKGTYKVWFLNSGKEEIFKAVSDYLTSNEVGMVPAEAYTQKGYVIEKDTNEQAIEFIQMICSKLNALDI